jgi:GT2 family glycosyltransferase
MIRRTVSVIIPCFNAQQYLRETIDCVLGQSYPDIEIIAVNDGSTDATRSILETYGHRVIVVNQRNQGRSAARNMGLSRASGEYVLFLDSDDLIDPRHLELLAAAIDFSGAGIAYCKADAFVSTDPSKRYLYRHVYYDGMNADRIILGNFINMHCGLIRRSVLNQTGVRFVEGREHCEDWEFWARLILSGVTAARVNQVLAHIRDHSQNTSRNMVRMQEEHIVVLQSLEKAFPSFSSSRRGKRLVSISRTRAYFQLASMHVFQRNRSEGLRYLLLAFKRPHHLRGVDVLRTPGILFVGFLGAELPMMLTRIIFGQHCAAQQRIHESS